MPTEAKKAAARKRRLEGAEPARWARLEAAIARMGAHRYDTRISLDKPAAGRSFFAHDRQR